ncbi:MAG: hypothetical protein KO464_07140 [Candidatus Methanofastidiosum sp.]|nr:hypothetical protein [Methanofastidiosum sp.]
MFCEHEGRYTWFNLNGSAEIGPFKFTLLQCMSCHDDIAISGELQAKMINCEEKAQFIKKILEWCKNG